MNIRPQFSRSRWLGDMSVAVLLTCGMGLVGGGCANEVGGDPVRDTGKIDTQVDTAGGSETQATTDETATPGETGEEEATVPTDVLAESFALFEVDPGKGLTLGLEQVELRGSGFFQGMQVFFGESLAQDIFVLDPHRLVLLTPPRTPGLVDVKIVDPDPDHPQMAVLEKGFLYFNPIAITSVTPDKGHVLGGERVTVRGAGFRAGSQLLLGTRAALQVEVVDDTMIRAIAPAGTAVGAVDVHVSNDLGVGTLVDGYLYVDVPAITAVIPPAGPLAGGNEIELRGTGFHDPVTVLVGGKALENLERVSDTRIRGTVPAGSAAGSTAVIVASAYGTRARANGYTYLETTAGSELELLAVSPDQGSVLGGDEVVVVAKGLGQAADTMVFFDGVPAAVTAVHPESYYAVVETPAGPEGPVDVEVKRGSESSKLTGAFTYRSYPRVTSVTPNHGPDTGGTTITIEGDGFFNGLELHVGALAAAQVEVLDRTHLRAVTPPGAPGLADIIILQSGQITRLQDAFLYDSDFRLWLVDPSQGSQAGGTQVTLVGSGFPADAKVTFGDRNATHVNVVSPTIITAKTPPGDLGVVSVKVTSATAGEKVLNDGFTYYDPTSAYGGTWGGGIKGDVNVTVLDGGTGGPIPDAFVMLWTDPRTPYQGFTNQGGQVTFSGSDLAGEQMVSASKVGYTRASVVEYNATNVTVFLIPTGGSPGGGGGGDPVEPATYHGSIKAIGKSIPVPLGRCSNKFSAPGTLCDSCSSDTTCGAASHCLTLPEQGPNHATGKYCTKDCVSAADCPSDFACLPMDGATAMQCVPRSGDLTAFCDITNTSIFADDQIPEVEVNPDFTFDLELINQNTGNPIFGEFAVICWGGVMDRTNGVFTPLALGLHRHVFANPGDKLEGELELNHPLLKTFNFKLDPVPRGPEGPDYELLFPYVELAGDGVIFFPVVQSFGAETFILEHFLSGLTGDLYDAVYTFLAGSFSFTFSGLPYTVTLHQNLTRLEDDTMFYLKDDLWTARRTGITQNVNGLWWSGQDVVGVGTDGLVVRSIGETWARQDAGVDRTLYGVHGLEGGSALAVGDGGVISRWDGFRWTAMTNASTANLRSVWMASETEAFAVGAYVGLQMQGETWSTIGGQTARNLYGVWGFAADDVWAVGASGVVIHWDGVEWKLIPTGTSIGLRAAWGAAPDDVWFVGEGGLVLHWNGADIQKTTVGTLETLTAIWGTASDRVIAVGGRGVAMEWNGQKWQTLDLGAAAKDVNFVAIAGDATGNGPRVMTGEHELRLGPILAVPENLSPGEGDVMSDAYRLSWQTQPGPDPHFTYVEVDVMTMFGPSLEWSVMNDYDVQSVLLPDFPTIEGTPGIDPGDKVLLVIRVYKEGFDIDNYSNSDLSTYGWRSWSQHQVNFTKL